MLFREKPAAFFEYFVLNRSLECKWEVIFASIDRRTGE